MFSFFIYKQLFVLPFGKPRIILKTWEGTEEQSLFFFFKFTNVLLLLEALLEAVAHLTTKPEIEIFLS